MVNGRGNLDSHGLVDVMADMDKFDAERLRELVERHARYTNSAKAQAILADWGKWLPRFKKVMPVDYRDALKQMAKVQEADRTGFAMLEIGVKR